MFLESGELDNRSGAAPVAGMRQGESRTLFAEVRMAGAESLKGLWLQPWGMRWG